MEPKEKLLDRMEQSFFIYKKGFLELTLPFFIITFIGFFIIGFFATFVVLPIIELIFNFIYPLLAHYGLSVIVDELSSIYNFNYIHFALPILFLVVFYIFSYIFVFILTIKNIIFYYQNYENDDKNNFKEQIIKSRKNILKIMKTYWYIFAYVALIPALLFIFGGILFNATYFLELPELVSRIGIIFMITGFILFIIFSIYRGIKTTFSLYSAIESEEFTKQNFKNSVKSTNGFWWRIFGNTFIFGLIIGLFFSLFSGVLDLIFPSLDNFVTAILKGDYSILLIIKFIIYGLIESIINSISIVYLMVFTYLLYRRIFFEKNISTSNKNDNLDKNKTEDLVL